MRTTLHVAVILRAAQIQGGIVPLAAWLGVSLADLQTWARMATPLPQHHFLRLLDLIAEDTLRELRTGELQTQDAPQESGS